ncbi:aryl hydrocarbon receptor nuclear translocator-like protein 1 isoform X3 [Leptopilina boulardi]|uniref:aryl hydrocarbon receptor nuclear translocator-like protein 1 isoform X3 n=1 Tax=Leptopilina boulardi TaxID=63433 RepID=UPI0021F57B27|nr:aryl hydrocarbon receptor nuclear translocator-like protein 1 isoform X3 [Leptopilina boulardi]
MKLEDEEGLLPTSGDVFGNSEAVKERLTSISPRIYRHPQHHHHQQQDQRQRDIQSGDLFRYRYPVAEMVAQEMSQGYTQLLHQTHEPQEYISLEELRPRLNQENHNQNHRDNHHNQISTSTSNTEQLYQHQNYQEPNYYNLSNVQESSCSTIYFGDIGSGVGELGGTAGDGEGLGPIPTPGQVNINRANDNTGIPKASGGNTIVTSVNTSTITTTSLPQTIAGTKPPQHMETTPPSMINDQTISSDHYYHHHHQQQEQQQPPRRNSVKQNIHTTNNDSTDDFTSDTKKRKICFQDRNDTLLETGDDAKSFRSGDDNKKQNHSEIEKRRRDKMNTYITELSAMIPMCHAMSRKLDKLTVLRMTVQHLKTILGAVTSYTEGHYKPAFLSDQELKTLILQAAEGFVFVVGCDRGRILYVSKSVSQILNYSQGDLLGQSWFDILHPKDVAKVKEQLSSSDLSPRERLIDAKTMLPVKTDVPQGVSRLCPGARRSFLCRMKRKVEVNSRDDSQIKEETHTNTGCQRRKKQQNLDWKYCVIQCTGYLKSWAPTKIGFEEQEGEGDGEACNLSCLVAVGRIQTALSIPSSMSSRPRLRTIEFVSRHAMDGKFIFVDQRVTLVLGYLPQELLGTSMYEYYHHDDIPFLAESHKTVLQSQERISTQVYRFRSKEASFVRLQSEWKSFKNPWTKEIEYIIAKNSAVYFDTRQVESSAIKSEGSSVQGNYDYFTQSNGGLERLISSQVEVRKIGRQIAEEVLDLQRRCEDSSSIRSPDSGPEPVLFITEPQITATASPERNHDLSQSGIGSDGSNSTSAYNQIRNNVQLSSAANDQGVAPHDEVMEIIGNSAIAESPNSLPTDGNDEAAMAVIMSLLEADAGLGGPVDFSGLPWPLP